ncbi:MAG: immunoglobulin-like domain-containing protein [Candidatus Paceibacterota bacterium]|jgi:hypothetical protein
MKLKKNGSVDTAVAGSYFMDYSVKDSNGNEGSKRREIIVQDLNPVITLLGNSVIDLRVGENYVDPGTTAIDDVDGDVTEGVIVGGLVDTVLAGTYVLTYSVTDEGGNISLPVTRTVNVTPIPVIPEVSPPRSGGGGGVSTVFLKPVATTTEGRVLGASTYRFLKVLKLGARSVGVKELQDRLRTEGFYKGATTGYFGNLTRVALKAYQKKNGLVPYGILNKATMFVLNK